METYQQRRMAHILADRPLKEKKKYTINKISPKRQEKINKEKEQRGDNQTEKEKWFDSIKPLLTRKCGCGCGLISSRHDTMWRCNIAHIFPQKLFRSIQFHKENWIERNFWNGHHTNMDNRSLDLWPQFADWQTIREKFFNLSPLLTDKERATKFYHHLERLVYAHP